MLPGDRGEGTAGDRAPGRDTAAADVESFGDRPQGPCRGDGVRPHRTCGRLRPACAVLWKKRPGRAGRADRVPAGIVERPPPDERADDAGNGESVGDVLAEGERPTLRRM